MRGRRRLWRLRRTWSWLMSWYRIDVVEKKRWGRAPDLRFDVWRTGSARRNPDKHGECLYRKERTARRRRRRERCWFWVRHPASRALTAPPTICPVPRDYRSVDETRTQQEEKEQQGLACDENTHCCCPLLPIFIRRPATKKKKTLWLNLGTVFLRGLRPTVQVLSTARRRQTRERPRRFPKVVEYIRRWKENK